MYSKCDDGIMDPLYYNTSYIEVNDLKVFSKFIHKNSVIFDIGANTGIYSLISGIITVEGQVYSFEPNPVNLKRLKKNIELNSSKNITVIPKAVGGDQKKISFTVLKEDVLSDTSSAIESFSKNTYSGTLEWKNIEVEQITLDSFCEDNKIEKVDLIKIDVEGYEVSVLEGAIDTIRKHKPLILLETFLNEEKQNYLESFIKTNGYYIYLILTEGIVKTGQEFKGSSGLNYLLLNNETEKVFTPLTELGKLRHSL